MSRLKFSINCKLHLLFILHFVSFSYVNFIVVVLLQYLIVCPTKNTVKVGRRSQAEKS